ncbi:AMP-binding protein [Polaromonas sp. P1(28)-13]|nr:AMP-binding protein [Polaromonas sp. P1(28)-13]
MPPGSICCPAICAARSVIAEKFDPLRMLNEIQQHRITQLMLVPTMLSRLLDLLDSGVPANLSSLRRVSYGTAPTSVELIERALRHFGPILRQQYGMTEAVQPLAVLYPHDHVSDGSAAQRKRLSSCGKPTMNVSITIRNPADQEVPSGEIGEIAIDHRGIGAVEFWRKPELAAKSILQRPLLHGATWAISMQMAICISSDATRR